MSAFKKSLHFIKYSVCYMLYSYHCRYVDNVIFLSMQNTSVFNMFDDITSYKISLSHDFIHLAFKPYTLPQQPACGVSLLERESNQGVCLLLVNAIQLGIGYVLVSQCDE